MSQLYFSTYGPKKYFVWNMEISTEEVSVLYKDNKSDFHFAIWESRIFKNTLKILRIKSK